MNSEYFEGHTPRECGEHRTVGSHRAWCHDCGEWCYPRADMACKGCELPALRAQLADLTDDRDSWQAQSSDLLARLAEVEAATVNRCIEAVVHEAAHERADEFDDDFAFARSCGLQAAESILRSILRSLLPATPAELPTADTETAIEWRIAEAVEHAQEMAAVEQTPQPSAATPSPTISEREQP